jgi:type IX secretion system PorP/SprF family membrane protein
MKRFLGLRFLVVCLLIVVSASPAHAQEFTSSQYYSNLPRANAGFTGIDDYMDVKTSVYQGWNSFDIGNKNFYVSAFSSINSSKRVAVKNNTLRISTSNDQTYPDKSIYRKHGMGGTISARNVGPYRSLTLGYNYAYHLPLSKKISFSLGSNIAYFNQRIDFLDSDVRDRFDDFYLRLKASGIGNQSSYLMDFGAVAYAKNFYVAVSSVNLIKGKLSSDNQLKFSEAASYQLHTAFNAPLGENIALSTGLRLILKDGYDMSWSANSRFRYKELLYIGGGYDNNSQLSLFLGISVNNGFNLHYAYDQHLSALSDFDVNAHEIVLGINLFNKVLAQPKFW